MRLILATIVILIGFTSGELKAQPATVVQKQDGSEGVRPTERSAKLIDLDSVSGGQVVVDREAGQYLGHPTTCLLEDGKTILCVYPRGHGRGEVLYKRSRDGGKSWSDRLPTPESWATSKETPTLHRVVDAAGKKRIIMFSGLFPARMAVSNDDGESWSELAKIGDWGGIVVMGAVFERSEPGHYVAMFHDDGRFFKPKVKKTIEKSGETKSKKKPVKFTLFQTESADGGLSWGFPEAVHASTEKHICEPGVVRSPDGKQLACLLRENSRRHNSQVIFSNDEGATWTEPADLPDNLNGDRHTAKYGPDGRLFISFRRRLPKGKTCDFVGDWVGWVGTYEDIVNGNDGQYLVRLKNNHDGSDCAYPGVEILPDGTFVTTTYGHWVKGEPPYVLTVRFNFSQLDKLAQ